MDERFSNPTKRLIVPLALISTLVFSILGCVRTSAPENVPEVVEIEAVEEPVEEVQERVEIEPTETPEPTPEPETTRRDPAPAGEEAYSSDMAFTVLEVIRPATDLVLAGDEFELSPAPEEGQEYVLLNIQVRCAADFEAKCTLDTNELYLVGSKGIVREVEWAVSGVSGLLDYVEFYGEAVVTGSLPFIVDQDESDLLLVYETFLEPPLYMALPEGGDD